MPLYMNYSDQLRDSRWRTKRLEILERDDYTCRGCQTTKNLQVHHTIYFKGKMAWEYENHLLIALCDSCHQNIEEDITEIKHALAILQLQDPTGVDRVRVHIKRMLNSDNLKFYNELRYGGK